MSFREVPVHEIREVLRLWLRGEADRAIARLASVDRKTVKRYTDAGQACGLVRDGGEDQLSDELVGQVCERVRPHRPDGHGASWAALRANHDQLEVWLIKEGLTVVKAHDLLARQGTVVPQRSLHRYALCELGVGRSLRSTTVRVADGDPGSKMPDRLRAHGPDTRSGQRPVPGVLGAGLHRRLQPPLLRAPGLSPDHRGSHRRLPVAESLGPTQVLAQNVPLTWHFRSSPNGIRTRVSTLRGWCPRPLDDGAVRCLQRRSSGGRTRTPNVWTRTRCVADYTTPERVTSQVSGAPPQSAPGRPVRRG
jgi:hypothetical protein